MDESLTADMCMSCMHDLHDHWQCKGGPEPTPDGDQWFDCTCDQAWLDHAKAGERLVIVNPDYQGD